MEFNFKNTQLNTLVTTFNDAIVKAEIQAATNTYALLDKHICTLCEDKALKPSQEELLNLKNLIDNYAIIIKRMQKEISDNLLKKQKSNKAIAKYTSI